MAGGFGKALSAASQGSQSSEEELKQDLRHIAQRASPKCFAEALSFYRERVKWAAGKQRTLPSSELCAEKSTMPTEMKLESAQEASVAFLILANDHFAQVRRLISRVLHATKGLVLCHLDRKVAKKEDLEEFRRWASRSFEGGSERAQIFSTFAIHRGGRSMLDVQLAAMRLLLASAIAWDYYVNLSDTHYPAEAMSFVGSYLWLNRGANYARITSTKFYDPTLQGGKDATYSGPRREDLYIACDRSLAFECEGQLFSVTPGVKYPPLWGVKAASGPEWLMLNRAFVEYVQDGLNSSTSLVRVIYDDLASLSIPEETFFQTLLLTSRFCHSVLRHEFLYLDLYNAPWRRSLGSDFPFQSPRPLNGSHLRDIAAEEPWFVRKVDGSTASGRALRGALDSYMARREKPRWQPVAMPKGLLHALQRFGHVKGQAQRSTTATKRLALPQRLRLRLRLHGVEGTMTLVERLAVPDTRSLVSSVVAMRIGCSWNEELYAFEGEVALMDAETCGIASLVSYMGNVPGFETEVAIHWFLEGQLMRQSGGQIPKGFSMFVDRLSKLLPGRWRVTLTDTRTGHRIGERSFIIYGGNVMPRLENYQEFFDFSPALPLPAGEKLEKEASLE